MGGTSQNVRLASECFNFDFLHDVAFFALVETMHKLADEANETCKPYRSRLGYGRGRKRVAGSSMGDIAAELEKACPGCLDVVSNE